MAEVKLERIEILITELESIKKLLVYWLMKNGMSQGDIAKALGINQSTVSRMFFKPVVATTSKEKAIIGTKKP